MADKICSMKDFNKRGNCENKLADGEDLGKRFTDIVFDFDGTLVDTSDAIIKTWRYTLKEYGYDFTEDYLSGIVNGVSIERSLSILGVKDDGNFAKSGLKITAGL